MALSAILLLFLIVIFIGARYGNASRADQPAAPAAKPALNNVAYVAPDDPEVNAAIQAARRTLPIFWKAFSHPREGETMFMLKVAMPADDGSSRDHIWVAFIERAGNEIFGRAAHDDGAWRSLQPGEQGQRISVSAEQIDDWMYMRDGEIVGNYTLRALLEEMPDEAATFSGKLAKLPEP